MIDPVFKDQFELNLLISDSLALGSLKTTQLTYFNFGRIKLRSHFY